ncbi:MAG TPA: NAD+ synthase [Nevskiaceae bacterium]|nr:NAD+ synthase [Nevskiaceae bacterium]
MSVATLALAQLSFRVGDVEGNARRIIAAAAEARDRLGAGLLLTPELSLIGYPPDDLLLRSALPAAVAAALDQIRGTVRGIDVVVGHPEFTAEGIYNAASVFRDGQRIALARKQLLPNYGVFDERRHFLPGRTGSTVFDWQGRRFGLCICEDIWGPGPAADAQARGAELLIALNASPYDRGKAAGRDRVLRARAAETGLPLIYLNTVGGQDDLVFDGRSQVRDGRGEPLLEAPAFGEGLFALSLDGAQPQPGQRGSADDELALVYQALVVATRDYVDRNGFPGALVGLSGGIDSALVAAIAADALGPERVRVVSLPSRYTLGISNDDAAEQARALGLRYERLSIEPAFEAFSQTLAPLFAGRSPDLTEENLQSRCRGVLLMALSNKFGSLVLTTGNKSEMAVGYATLYGDMCGGFAPIKDCYKTLVYDLARWRNTRSPVIPPRVIERPPSAELRPDQKDSDSLPPYEVLDPILEAYVEHSRSVAEIVALGYERAVVERVARLVQRAEYKRRQAPPGPKITPCAFGRERRYPLTAFYGAL